MRGFYCGCHSAYAEVEPLAAAFLPPRPPLPAAVLRAAALVVFALLFAITLVIKRFQQVFFYKAISCKNRIAKILKVSIIQNKKRKINSE
nr:MAG: hypothetical protein [Bacteriophage sp.]